LGVAFIAAALFGPKASEILQQRCGLLLLKFIGRQGTLILHGVQVIVERIARRTSQLGRATEAAARHVWPQRG
jgi:hypothetical protein